MNKNEDKEPLNEVNEENGQETAQPSSEGELPDAAVEQTDPVAKAEAELSAFQDKYLRLYSEFENYKKRVSRDRIEQAKMAGSELMLSILPVIDDFERALKSSGENGDVKTLREGVQLIYNKLKNSMEARGLKPMNAAGNAFDPELHDAIVKVPAPEPAMKGKVVEEIEKGYYLNDKVLRHSKVVVGE